MCEDIFCMRTNRTESYISFILASSCMPTLMKIKPSTMVCFHKRYIEEIDQFYELIDKEVMRYHCEYELLFENSLMLYIMIYQEDKMKDVFIKYQGHDLLLNKGYRLMNETCKQDITNFAKRFQIYKKEELEFPHEVGIFLGYPIEDVEAFIEYNGNDYILCGYWKVYHNKEEALKTFELYKSLREIAIEKFYLGEELPADICCA